MDRANDVWIEELRQPGPRREAALADLRADVLRGMRGALAGRAGIDDAFFEDAVQETLLKVLDRLETFAGRGRFVNWALAIAIRVVQTTIRKQRWQGVSLDRFKEESSGTAVDVADQSQGPERASLRSELLTVMHRYPRAAHRQAMARPDRRAERDAPGRDRPAARQQPQRCLQTHARRPPQTQGRTRGRGIWR